VNTAINKTVLDDIKAKVKIKKLSKDLKEKIDSYKAGIKDDLNIEVVHKTQTFDIPAKLEVTLCPKCSKKGTQFFDSTIQLRNCTEEVLAFARNEVAKQQKKGIFITKEVPIEKYSIKDIDMYLTNQTYAKTLADKIRKNFGGTIKKNAKHFSLNWQTTKTLYRLNILLQLPSYKKNDVIKDENHLYRVISLGAKIHVTDLKTNHKTSLPNKESYDVLHPVLFQVIKRYPEYEVLDPNTYYQARLMNPSKKLEINQKVKVVIDGSEAWMV
jgi:NMD protein affecting ribosome stability and mRNA decay